MVMMMPMMMMPIGHIVGLLWIFGVVALVDSKHSFDTSDDTTDRGTDDGTDWACDAVAFMKAMNCASGNALSLGGQRQGEHRKARTANKQFHNH